jgi:ATP-dependent protease HslVU (ClpYQ) peptidase subunit
VRHTKLPANQIVLEALKIASQICIFTNSEIIVEEL